MIKKKQMKNITIRVYEDDYKVFKAIAKENDSDANKEIRKMMKKYIKDNIELVNKLF